MRRLLANPDRLFHRTWRPRHPLRPRLSALRRGAMLLLLVLLLALIWGYVYFTDSDRVRALAGKALSQLLGGNVQIQHAELSLFEGLRLDGVSLNVDNGHGEPSPLFSARTFLLHIKPAALLAGKLRIAQIIAIEPTVNLWEDPATHQWNYQWLHRSQAPTPKPGGFHPEDLPPLPEVILRDAQVRYSELRDNQPQPVGWLGLEIHFAANTQANGYDFSVQSHGQESVGAQVSGSFDMPSQTLRLELAHVAFGPDLKAMIPAEIHQRLRKLALDETINQLGGKIDKAQITYTLAQGSRPATFDGSISLEDADFPISPDRWRSQLQITNQHFFQEQVTAALRCGWISAAWAADLRRWGTPLLIHLHQVNADMEFTQTGLVINNLSGQIENNWLNVSGRLDGYDADAPLHLEVSSLAGKNVEIPEWSPGFVGSLPESVRVICDQFQPRGTCALQVRLDRAKTGGPIDAAGRLDILNGGMTFEDFPYPLRNMSGAITVSRGDDGKDYLRIVDVSGYGIAGSANANTKVTVSGKLGPLDDVAGVDLTVLAKNVACDKALRAAMPIDVDAALALFDPQHRGELPQFTGDFAASLHRPRGKHQHWVFEVDIDMRDAMGTLASFPYPLENLAGRLEVHDGYLDIHHAHMHKGGMDADIDGKVIWQDNPTAPAPRDANGKPMLGPQLNITAHHLQADAALLGALPPSTADWLKQIGALAVMDINARVMPGEMAIADPANAGVIAAPAKPQRDVNYLVDVKLADGLVFANGPTLALNRLSGALRITPDRLTFSDMTASRGDMRITAAGDVDLSGPVPRLHLQADAKDLAMDTGLYAALPPSVRDGWDDVHPEGTLDATLKLDTSLGERESDASSPPAQFTLVLTPRDLAITPASIPYRLAQLKGTVTFLPGTVKIDHLQGNHGPSTVAYDGTGHLDNSGQWNLKIAAHNLDADDDFMAGLPDALRTVCKAAKLNGKVDIDISQLAYQPATRPGAGEKLASGDGPDVNVAAKITLACASLQAGVPMSDVSGTVDVAAIVRRGKLSQLKGKLDIPTLQAAGRSASGLKADLSKNTDDPTIHIANLQAAMADGDLSGQIDLGYPENAPAHYDLSLVCHDMDIHQMLNNQDDKVHGRLTGSLTLGGAWNDTKDRRGHGDMRVNGEEMYGIPAMLGMLRMMNLQMPVSKPFTQATARYQVDGPMVYFEAIELSSADMSMSGTGTLDFGKKTVDLTMSTNNPALLSIPLLGVPVGLALHELTQIHVSGHILEPKVSSTSVDTISTTVEEVLKKDKSKP